MLQSLDDTVISDYLWEDYQIRYVLVPGIMNLNAKGLNWENYDEVVEYSGFLNKTGWGVWCTRMELIPTYLSGWCCY